MVVNAYRGLSFSFAMEPGCCTAEGFCGHMNTNVPLGCTYLEGDICFSLGQSGDGAQGVWMFNFIEKYAPGLEWGAAPFPHPANRPDLARATNVEADQLVIPTGSAHPDEAFEFMLFVSSQEAMEMLCLGMKKHSPLREMSAGFVRDHPRAFAVTLGFPLHDVVLPAFWRAPRNPSRARPEDRIAQDGATDRRCDGRAI